MHRMTKSNARNVAQAGWWRVLLLQLVLASIVAELSAQEAEVPAEDAKAAAPSVDEKSGLATLFEVKLPLGSGCEAPLKKIITPARERVIA